MSSKSSADKNVPLAALILAGGKSSRMGEPKHGVLLSDGRPMIAHVLDALLPLNIPIHISVPKGQTSDTILDALPYPKIEDQEEYQGPLVAIAHGLQKISANRLLVVCCDQPLLNSELFCKLMTASPEASPIFFESNEGERQTPFPGIYPRSLLSDILDAIAQGERSPNRWLSKRTVITIPIMNSEIDCLKSFNTQTAIKDYPIP